MKIFKCFLLFFFMSIGYSLDDENFIGDVENLMVAVVHDEESESFKLNVSWLPPENAREPSFYSVLITTIQVNSTVDNETRSSTCLDGSIYHTIQDIKQTYVLLPENRFAGIAVDNDELEIDLGCSYKVQVFANPRNNHSAETSPSTIFTVPDCVGNYCNCKKSFENLPVPIVNVRNIYNGSILISWKVNSKVNDSFVQSYKISVGLPHLTSSSGLTVYNKTEIYTASADDDSFLWNHESLKKGTKISVNAQDLYGCSGKEGSFITKRPRPHPFYRKNATAIVFAGLVGICLMISGIFSFIKYLSRNYKYQLLPLRKKSSRQLTAVLSNPKIEAVLKNHNSLYIDQGSQETKFSDPYEIIFERLSLVRELGQGEFGKVYLANLHRDRNNNNDESCSFVAVKMSLTSSDSTQVQLEVRQQLLEEIAITKIAGSHPHLVGLIGCCTLDTNPVCLVLEYMQGGDLLGYLHRMRDSVDASNANHEVSSLESPGINSIAETTCTSLGSQSPTTPTSRVFFANDIKPEDFVKSFESENLAISQLEMMRFALEISKGMEHLEAKGIIHRDLAARNVLMDRNLVLKISDFGLSRKGTYTLNGSGTRRLPIRWMPAEAIRRRAFTSKSDVWSYGIVLWEIASLGDFPYAKLSDDTLLHHLLEENGRPEKITASIPDAMRDLMEMCWAISPERRPNFKQIVLWLENKNECGRKNNPGYLDVVV